MTQYLWGSLVGQFLLDGHAAYSVRIFSVEILLSPDGRFELAEQDGNLSLRDRRNPGQSLALTSDGMPLFGYGTRPGAASTARRQPPGGQSHPPVAVWSPDSRFIAVQRLDERRVGELHLVQHLPGQAGRRTTVRSYRHPLPGETEVPEAELWIIEAETATATRVDLPAQPLLWVTPIELGRVWWSEDAATLYVLTSDRGERALELFEVDPATGTARRILREDGSTYVESNLDISRPPNVAVVSGSGEVIWFSERSGWAHLELRDSGGGLIRTLTEGDFVVRDLVHLDPGARQAWFTASGREDISDRYYRQLYRVSLDGSPPMLLTPEDADHQVSLEPSDHSYRVVDEYARVDGPSVCVVRDLWSGAVIETRWEQPPAPTTAEPFQVLARDHVTPLFGVMFHPSDFDPGRRYPVIDHVYGFPQTIATPKRSAADGPWQSLADLGCVVVILDGLGTAFRHKAFHDLSYGALEDATLPDHVAALHQLAERHPWINLDRVGVFGSSGGGTTTVRALLQYPELFKVGVAISGGYDHRDSIAYILEKYQGPDPRTWAATDVSSLAARLQGKLLLVWGELDDNVHPSSSLRLLDAFIRADKEVDVLVIPGADHFVGRHPYVQRRIADYFTRHL